MFKQSRLFVELFTELFCQRLLVGCETYVASFAKSLKLIAEGFVSFRKIRLSDIKDFKIVDYGRLRRLVECHATWDTRGRSPSDLWDGVFSRGFSSCWRRSNTVRTIVNDMPIFSLLFPDFFMELVLHMLEHGFLSALKLILYGELYLCCEIW